MYEFQSRTLHIFMLTGNWITGSGNRVSVAAIYRVPIPTVGIRRI